MKLGRNEMYDKSYPILNHRYAVKF